MDSVVQNMEKEGRGTLLPKKIDSSCTKTFVDKRLCNEQDQFLTNLKTSTDGKPTLLDVLNNDLIADEIISYLTLADMKEASEVSVDMCRVIRQTRQFKKKVVLVLFKDKSMLEIPQGILKLEWRSLRLHVDDTFPEKYELNTVALINILGTVTFLSIFRSDNIVLSRFKSLLSFSIFCNFMKASPNLNHLHLDPKFFEYTLPRLNCSCPPFHLKSLKRLDILKWNDDTKSYFRGSSDVTLYPEKFQRRMHCGKQMLTTLFHVIHKKAKSLQSFSICSIEGFHCNDPPPVQIWVTPILKLNVVTLEELVLHNTAWSLEEMKTLEFKQLKKLAAFVSNNEERQKTLAQFIRKHETLTELEVSWLKPDNFNSDNVRELWESIVERSEPLRKLHLKTDEPVPELNWNFLKSMTKLKDFCFLDESWNYTQNGTGAVVLRELPRNQVERLRIHSRAGRFGFWNKPSDKKLERKKEILMGFTSLRCLTIHQVLDNDLVQFILKEFTHLEELEVTDCEELTHNGFIGEEMNSAGVSINNLKRLKRVSLKVHWRYPSLRDGRDELFEVISLPALQYFEYSDRQEVPASLLWTLAKNNPSLETIKAKFESSEELQNVLENVKESGHRLRKVLS